MSEPLISVVIPSYNRGVLLKERSIPSVLRQTYRNWEVIVVSDGPTNGHLREVVESFRDKRIRYAEIPRPDYDRLSRKERWFVAGAEARNHGLSLTRGELIAPLDDDDAFTPNHLSDCAAMLGGGHADLVYGCVLVRNMETGREYPDYFPWAERSTRERFRHRNVMFHCSVCYTAGYRNLNYPTDGSLAADYGLWLRIQEAGGRFASLSSPQAIYYGDQDSGVLRLSVPTLPSLETVWESIEQVFESRMLSNDGPLAQRLECALADYLGAPHVLCTANGDLALVLALHALGSERHDDPGEVVLPSYAHPSLVNAILWNRFEPVFCDVDSETLCITPRTVERCLTRRTAVIAALHPHGFPAEMAALEVLARDHGVYLLADAAAALGASLHGRRIGGFGDVETFSLSGTKGLTTGEGGLICTRSERIASAARQAGRYGLRPDYQAHSTGINGKLAEIPAALGLAGIPHLDGWLVRRRRMESRYRERLGDIPQLRFSSPSHPSAVSACKDMLLILPTPRAAQELVAHLSAYQIASRPYYRVLHRMPAYRDVRRDDLPVTEELADCTVCVPLYSDIRERVVDLVASVVREACR